MAGGQRERGIARALAHQRSLIIACEAISALMFRCNRRSRIAYGSATEDEDRLHLHLIRL